MDETADVRPLFWVASSKRDFVEMPEDVVSDFWHWLFQVQMRLLLILLLAGSTKNI